MNIDDITSYLYTNQISSLLSTAATGDASETAKTGSTEFSDMLDTELSNLSTLSEFSQLAEAMSGSVLGSITDTDSLQALSDDLMSTGSGREVLTKLAEGHLNSIVLTEDDDDDDESTTITNTLSSYEEAVSDTSTLTDLITEAMETLNTATEQ